MKTNFFFKVLFVMVLALGIVFTACENGTQGNDDDNGETPSPYAGTWQSNQYQAKMVIEGSDSLIATLQLRSTQTDPWENTAKGSLEISGTNATLMYTHVWKNNDWSNNQVDITAAWPVIIGPEATSNIMTGTITGSTAGSILFGHLVKQ
jgi:hypothetical protein